MGIANLDSLMAQIACGDVSEFTGCTQLSKEVVEQRINSKASVAINERDFGETIVTDTSINNGKLLSTLNKQIAFPKFRLFVDSDYLTLSIPTGEPDVTCPSTVKFAEGEQGQITVSAKNLGENEGGFNLKVLSCDGNFAEGDTAGITLNGGETKSVTLKTTAQTQLGQTVSGSCVIEMKESTTQKVDTCSVNLEATAPLECTIGRVWCSYDGTFSVIKNCPEGTPQILTKCTSTQSCDIDSQGIPFCKSLGGNNGSNNEQTCNALATSQPYLGWVWAESSSEVGDGPFGIGKIIGLTHTETEGKCEPTFAVYYMIGVVLIVMIISILFLMRSPKPQQYQPRPRQQYAPRNY